MYKQAQAKFFFCPPEAQCLGWDLNINESKDPYITKTLETLCIIQKPYDIR